MIAIPTIAVLDTATLANLSRDYWSAEAGTRDKARSFMAWLRASGVLVAFTLSHVIEVLGHGREKLVRDRLSFLANLPLLAWLRPYSRTWFPGSAADLSVRELHAVLHRSARTWAEIISAVRPDLWETGTGSEMFVQDEELWSRLIAESQYTRARDQYIASVARADVARISQVTLAEAFRLPRRPKEQVGNYFRRFAAEMQRQFERHGDRRLQSPEQAARHFALDTFQRVRAYEKMGGDPAERILEATGVPAEILSPEMTIGELGALAVYAEQLRILSKGLQPQVQVTMKDVPPDVLPSCALERRISAIQRKAERVSGSDLGDGHISTLLFYADYVQVDKRTKEYLNQLRRREPEMAALMGRVIPDCDYSQLPSLLGK